MTSPYFPLIFFFYGLAFFSMGLAILLELGHGSDQRLRRAFRPLAAFGFLHGFHEWIEMFLALGLLPGQSNLRLIWDAILLMLLAFSFLSLAAFGVFLITKDESSSRFSLLIPLGLVAIWGIGLLIMRDKFPIEQDLVLVSNAWTRYILGVPSALLASAGLIYQQREFRRVGMAEFGRDCLWAALAFAWYGLVGQVFTRQSLLFPSNIINQDLFLQVFGFPIQLLRAVSAVVASVFIMRVLRSFEEENRREIAELQAARLDEAKRRETLRGEILRRIVTAQEAERQRIARELHDETGQALTAIGLGLRSFETSFTQDRQKAASNLKQLEHLVDHSLVELQRLISDLRPSHLDDLGLAPALRWYASEIQKRVSLNVNVTMIGEERDIPSEMKTALFRVAQEALTNTIKHSGADNVDVVVNYTEQGVNLSVFDDGVGFNSFNIQKSNRESWGLVGMEERANLLGGDFQIRSKPGSGTSVEVFIPYQAQKNGDIRNDTNIPG
jgi:signal transduction histidine kinase